MNTLLALPKGDASVASSRHRVHGLLEALAAHGWRSDLLTPSMVRAPRLRNLALDLSCAARSHDVLLVQRPGRRREERLVLTVATARARVLVLDLDDPVDETGVFAWLIPRAQLVLAGSEAIRRRYAGRVPVEVVPTPIDYARYAGLERRPRERPVIGFLGDAQSYAESLERMLRAITAAAPDARLHVVGTRGDSGLEARLRAAAPRLTMTAGLAWEDEGAVAAALAGFDIGLAPFRDAEGGSYKTVQYMAAGVVPLVEDGGEGARHARAALGESAPVVAPGDVRAALDLLADPARRAALSEAGRAAARAYDRRAVAARVSDLLRKALDDE